MVEAPTTEPCEYCERTKGHDPHCPNDPFGGARATGGEHKRTPVTPREVAEERRKRREEGEEDSDQDDSS